MDKLIRTIESDGKKFELRYINYREVFVPMTNNQRYEAAMRGCLSHRPRKLIEFDSVRVVLVN